MRFSINNTGSVLPSSGSLSATVTVTLIGASNSSLTVPVSLTLYAAGTTGAPFGAFDTPATGSSVAGSIAVTGWALDDVGIDRVEIWRDKVTGETTPVYTGSGPGNGKIFIANPLFISGARPDVEAAYSSMPLAYRAGLGVSAADVGAVEPGERAVHAVCVRVRPGRA